MIIELTEQEIREAIEMVNEAMRMGNAAEDVEFLLFMETDDLKKAMEIIANS